MKGLVLQEKYKLIEEVGSGGTAIVYKAYCSEDGKYYAAKILRPELVSDVELLNRFERESEALAGLAHPNIVNIHAVGVEEYYSEFNVKREIHYIIMDYVDGMTLKKYITARGALNPREAGYIAMQVCSALTHAHNNGIIHRDIKSHNIILNRDMQVKVADFGLARTLTQATLSSQTNKNVMGSVHYMSPEQTRNGYVSESTDLYSLGIVLYEALTGKLPFNGDDHVTVALKHVHEKLPPMHEQYPNIPRAYCYIVDKALQKNTMDRYKTATEMQNDLATALVNSNADLAVPQTVEEKKNVTVRERGEEPRRSTDEAKQEREKAYLDTSSARRENRANARKKRRTQVTLMWIGIVAAAVIALGVLVALIWPKPNNEYVMTDLRGKTREEAVELLKSNDIRCYAPNEEKQWIWSDEYPMGTVIDQDKKEGTVVIKNDTSVHLTISRGPKPEIMPSLVDLTLEDALDRLAKIGVSKDKISIIKQTSPKQNNIVFEQEPAENTEVFHSGKDVNGKVITIYVTENGEAPETVKVPSLVGLTKSEAQEKLAAAGLVAEFENEYSKEDVDIVYYQWPSADKEVSKGSKIVVGISKGPLNAIDMPELIGLNAEQVAEKLAQLGLTYSIEYNSESEKTVGLVYDYTPKKKKVVPGEDLITVWIAGEAPQLPSDSPEATPDETPSETPRETPSETPEATPSPNESPTVSESPSPSPSSTQGAGNE